VPDKSLQVLETAAIDESLLGVAAIFGTGATLKIAESGVLQRHQLTVAAATTGAKKPRALNNPALLFFRPSYQDEVKMIIKHCSTVGLKRYAFFYENSAFGSDGLEALVEGLSSGQGTIVARHAYQQGQADFSSAAKAFVDAKADVIVLFSVQNTAAQFIKALRTQGANQPLFSISVVNPDSLASNIGLSMAHGIAIAQVVPNPLDQKVAVSRLFQQVMTSQNRLPYLKSHSALEGFIVGALIVDILKNTKDPVTRQSFAAIARTMTYKDMGTIKASLDLGGHAKPKYLELGVIDRDGKLRN
jgi:branched-chain amino acid transport system substrate-binding protein